MRFVQSLGVAIVLAAAAAPVVAQTDTNLCLRVQAAPEVDLTDASSVQDGIGTGKILVTEVVPCGAVAAPSTPPVSSVGTGAWDVRPIEVDPLTDDRSAIVYLAAGSGTMYSGAPITLMITCTGGSTDLSVDWGWTLAPDELIDVATRIGDGEVTTDGWFNVGRVATAYGGAETAFIKSLFGETQLALRLTTPESYEITAVFDISGIENAVAYVRETCGW